MENISHPGRKQENNPGFGKPYLLADGVDHPCGQPTFQKRGFSHGSHKIPLMIYSPTSSFVHTPSESGLSDWSGHPTVCQLRAHPGWIFRAHFPCHAHGRDEAPPVMHSNSGGLNPLHCCRAGASWTLVQNDLLLLLHHILKVTGEARQGETSVCHLAGPPGHVHTSNLATPQEIIPLEGTGSRFSIPFS